MGVGPLDTPPPAMFQSRRIMSETPSIPNGKTLVTGATGHVGCNLVHRLLDEGEDVRVILQPGGDPRAVDRLPVERVEADLRDTESLQAAARGCVRAYHVAAKVSTLSPNAGEQRDLFEVNVMGTRNFLEACRAADVARVVVTGSFSATGFDPSDPSAPADETRTFYPFHRAMPYARTKLLSEYEVLKAVVEGQDAVIATSTACIGPWDYMPSRMGKTMCDYASGKLRAYVPGGFEFVRAADLVDGHLRAMERGRKGQKYIFATRFCTLEDLVTIWSEVMDLPKVRLKVPAGIMAGFTGLYSGTLARLFPNVPQRLTPGAIDVLRMRRHADTSKAQRELDWRPTEIRTAIIEAFEFFAREGMISRGPVVPVPDAASNERPASVTLH